MKLTQEFEFERLSDLSFSEYELLDTSGVVDDLMRQFKFSSYLTQDYLEKRENFFWVEQTPSYNISCGTIDEWTTRLDKLIS